MIIGLNDLAAYVPTIIVYPAGSSGEIFAYAITQSFPSMTKTQQEWENHTRCKILEFFDRSLTAGGKYANPSTLKHGVNSFLKKSSNLKGHSVGLAHPAPEVIDIITQYFNNSPIIEITTVSEKSKKFRYLSAVSKIKNVAHPPAQYFFTYDNCGHKFKTHMQIDWQEAFLDHTEDVYSRIQSFLDMPGDVDIFRDIIDDYTHRNQSTIHDL